MKYKLGEGKIIKAGKLTITCPYQKEFDPEKCKECELFKKCEVQHERS